MTQIICYLANSYPIDFIEKLEKLREDCTGNGAGFGCFFLRNLGHAGRLGRERGERWVTHPYMGGHGSEFAGRKSHGNPLSVPVLTDCGA